MGSRYLLILPSALILAAVACSKKTSNMVVEVADLSQTPGFQATQEIVQADSAAFNSYLEDRFGKSCRVQRGKDGVIAFYQDRAGFDPSLQDKDETYVSRQLSSQSGSRKMEQRYHVRHTTSLKTRVTRTTVSMFSLQAGGEILLKPFPENENCIFIDGEIDCKSETKSIEDYRPYMTSQGYEYFKAQPHQQLETCRIQSTTEYQSKTEKGFLRLQDGSRIPSYRETEVAIGPVICGDQNLGDGQVISYQVRSSAVKAIPSIPEIEDEMQTCGGALVIDSHSVSVGGKVVESFRFEQIKPSLK